MKPLLGYIFDLDGVIVDTATFHYLAWKETAKGIGFDLTAEDNEQLKGVSRMESLNVILRLAGITLSENQKSAFADQKNKRYLQLVETLTPSATLPGVRTYLQSLKSRGKRVALASASKNARRVLTLLEMDTLFDAVIDGTMISRTKPDPEIFLKAAEALQLNPEICVVFEDAQNGIEAAIAAGMKVVGIGRPERLTGATVVIPDFSPLCISQLKNGGID
jgi:beta-phosphoglucomutase